MNKEKSEKKHDWQVVTICDGFVIEVDCNSGESRRVYNDGRIKGRNQPNKGDDMSEFKPTKGECYSKRDGWSSVYVEVRIGGGMLQEVAVCGPTEGGPDEQDANAALIVDAFRMFDETGLTPRQLAEQWDELLEALKESPKALEAISDEMTVGERYTNAEQYLLDALNPARNAIAITPAYRDVLRLLFSEDWRAAHDEVKSENQRLKAMK